jgi:hypothetical protein
LSQIKLSASRSFVNILYIVRIRTDKCFTKSSKRFRCEVIFEKEYTLPARQYTTFAKARQA